MPTYDEIQRLESKLQVVVNRLIYLQDLIANVNTSLPVNEAEANKITLASTEVCEAYIDVLRAVGITNTTLKALGFDSCDNVKKTEITSFLNSLNALLRTDICDKQRAVLVNGAGDAHALLNSGRILRSSRPGIISYQKISGLELFFTFASTALINSSQLGALGYLINGINGAKLGAALGVLFTSMEKSYTETHRGELAQAKYSLLQITKAFYKGAHSYKYEMHPKNILKDNDLKTEDATFYAKPLTVK